MRAVRAACVPAWGVRLAEHVLEHAAPAAGAVVAGFWPLPGEIDVRPLLLALAGRGSVVALPITPAGDGPLTFHRWSPTAALRPGRFGTLEPAFDPVQPDVVFVPLLAFDRSGRRLGYGGGFYDRTLVTRRFRTIGCAFAAQEVEAVPVEPHDVRLDAVATENGVIFMEPDRV